MKNKIFNLFAMAVIVLAGVFGLSACAKDPEYVNVKIGPKQGTSQYLSFGNNSSYFYEDRIEKGSNFYTKLYLNGDYNPDTLKIYNGSTEISWTKNQNIDYTISTSAVEVGSISLSNVKSNINLKYQAKEKEINFTFKRSTTDTTELTQDQINMLKEFKLASNTSLNLYDMIKDGYVYKTTYSNLSTPINFVCQKDVCYYDVTLLNYGFKPNVSVSKNTYSLELPQYLSTENNDLTFNLSEIKINNFNVIYNADKYGNVLNVTPTDAFVATTPTQVDITLNKVNGQGLDYSNIKVYINDTLVAVEHDFNSGNHFTVDLTGKTPLDYYTRDLSLIEDFISFNIIVTGFEVTPSSASEFCVARIILDEEHTNLNSIYYSSAYYIDRVNNYAYFTEDPYVYIKNNSTVNNVVISNGTNNYTFSVNDIVNYADNADIIEHFNLQDVVASISLVGEENSEIQLCLKYQKGTTYTISVSD